MPRGKLVMTEVEREFILGNAATMRDKEAVAALSTVSGRAIPVSVYRGWRLELGLKKAPGRGVSRLATPKTDVVA